VKLKEEDKVLAVLTDANDRLKAQADAVRSKADAAQKEVSDRQEWIQIDNRITLTR